MDKIAQIKSSIESCKQNNTFNPELIGDKITILNKISELQNLIEDINSLQTKAKTPPEVKLYTREEVVKLLERILEDPEKVIDAAQNENTNYTAEELINLVE